ncbi:TlyA family RNA methyltransferase [Sulfurimonas sp. HSL-1656]|uniref:23S rRNA (cytidine-2'-O)-methyltransferase TlyA n=1 Tax=Thiomicrolovo subterrani TaxID=3131934 RepID=UPI0031F7B421
MRLDHYLVEAGLAPTRSKAQQLVKAGSVTVEGSVVTKPAFDVTSQQVAVTEAMPYVSRAALKLKGFLPSLPFDVRGMYALDIGASTGGFTQVLLEAGAAAVDAVDVGRDQLHPEVKADPRVRSFEQTDIRRFAPGRSYDVVTSDVSFISLHHILDDVERLAAHWIVLLFKPQFEVGRDAARDRKGVVTDQAAIAKAMADFEAACAARGWRLCVKEQAAITGKEGNSETCYCFERG